MTPSPKDGGEGAGAATLAVQNPAHLARMSGTPPDRAQPPATDTMPAPASPAPASLGRRLVLATLLFCLIFTAAAVGVRSASAWRGHLAAMNAELTLIDKVFQRTLSKAIWEMDREALETQLDSVAQVAAVGLLQVRIPRAGREAEQLEYRHADHTGAHWAPSLRHELVYEPYPGAHEVVGELAIEGNERLLWQRLHGELAGIVLTQVVQSLLLAGLIMWMFNRSVTVHVRRIARHLGELAPDNLHRPLHLQRQPRRDELNLLESGVNDLQAKLSAYLRRQRQYEQELAAHRDRLAELVEARTAELRAANTRLEELSRSDPLTGLANRRHFDETKEIEFRRALRLGQPLSVLMCDVDHFKAYNDTFGHAAGDDCLRNIAAILQTTFARAGELVARVGGEEFAALLPGVDAARARDAAERLRSALAARGLEHGAGGAGAYVTLSIGVAQLDPAEMDHVDMLLDRADQALYRAKREGRDRVAE
ncbi:MAG: GGDEF domain-containing protein [Rhodocyclaceae bacterium]